MVEGDLTVRLVVENPEQLQDVRMILANSFAVPSKQTTTFLATNVSPDRRARREYRNPTVGDDLSLDASSQQKK